MPNPSVGIHVLYSAGSSQSSLTTPTGHTSNASGSTFVAMVCASSAATLTVSDSNSNAYTLANSAVDTNDGQKLSVYYCANGVGAANHTLTVSGTGSVYIIELIEIVSAATSSPLDGNNSAAQTTGLGPLSCAVTPSVSGELVLAFGYSGGNASNVISASGIGYALLDQYSTTWTPCCGISYLASATTSSTDPGMSQTSSGALVAVTVSFKGTPSSSGNRIYLRRTRQRQIGG